MFQLVWNFKNLSLEAGAFKKDCFHNQTNLMKNYLQVADIKKKTVEQMNEWMDELVSSNQ